jgi:hypothetical protein
VKFRKQIKEDQEKALLDTAQARLSKDERISSFDNMTDAEFEALTGPKKLKKMYRFLKAFRGKPDDIV